MEGRTERTTQRRSKGTKLYAVRDSSGEFKDIQTYKRVPKEAPALGWRHMDTAPKDREILVRRHNGVFQEHFVVWWQEGEPDYPWAQDYNSYPADRFDAWHEIPA